MKNFLVILIILCFSGSFPASAFNANQIEWAPAIESTLYRGDTLTNGPYMVKAVQFPSPVQGYKTLKGEIIPDTPVDPMVYIELYKSGNIIKEVLLSMQSGAEIDPDYEIRVSGTGFPLGNSREWVQEYYKPWAKVAISLRGKPQLDVTISTEKTSYISTSDHFITAKVNVKNIGDAVARNVDVTFDAGDLKLRGDAAELHQIFMEIKKGESKSFEVVLLVPDLLDPISYSLTADAKGFDVKDLEYKSTKTTSITVSPKQNYFSVSKSVSKSRIYLNDIITVRLTIANSGIRDMNNIVLNDSINSNFELKSNTPLFWNIPVLQPGEWRDMEYSIRPLETSLSGFTFPEATAGFTANGKQYNIISGKPVVLVNGPIIVLNKTVDKQIVNISEDVTITVSVKNIGNIPTRMEVKDFLPENVSFVNGSTSLEPIFLELNTINGFNYTIRINTWDNIELPAAIANYTGVDYRGITRSAIRSERPVITVINLSRSTSNSTPTMTPNVPEIPSGAATASQAASQATPSEPAPTPITPGFNAIFGIAVLIFAAALMRK